MIDDGFTPEDFFVFGFYFIKGFYVQSVCLYTMYIFIVNEQQGLLCILQYQNVCFLGGSHHFLLFCMGSLLCIFRVTHCNYFLHVVHIVCLLCIFLLNE